MTQSSQKSYANIFQHNNVTSLNNSSPSKWTGWGGWGGGGVRDGFLTEADNGGGGGGGGGRGVMRDWSLRSENERERSTDDEDGR